MTAIREALIVSLNARRGVPAGQTVGDFIAALYQLGLSDSDPLSSVEYGIAQGGMGLLIREQDEHGNNEIRERF